MPPTYLGVGSGQRLIGRGFDVLLVAAATVSPSSETAAYMRVAAMSLAAYECVPISSFVPQRSTVLIMDRK